MLSRSEGQKENRAPVSICCHISFWLYKSGLHWCSPSPDLLFLSLDPKSPGLLTAPLAPSPDTQIPQNSKYDFSGSLGAHLWLREVLGYKTPEAGSSLTNTPHSVQTAVPAVEAGSLCRLSQVHFHFF